MKKQLLALSFGITLSVALCGCGGKGMSSQSQPELEKAEPVGHLVESNEKMDMDDGYEMDQAGSDDVLDDLKAAKNPKYKVGSQAIIKADHMDGMKGAKATIVGAYNTIAYIVTYKPTNGGDTVTNHRWVIQEEIEDAGHQILDPGTEVILDASHMRGMDGASAVIDDAEKTTVYMVDYQPTNGGPMVKNHKWVTEEELSPLKNK